MTQDKIYIYGKHALMEALKNSPRAIRKVFLAPTLKDQGFINAINKAKIPISALSVSSLPGDVKGSDNHQGVIGVISLDSLTIPYDRFVEKLTPNPHTSLVLLDEIQDPHNVGAIIRSAAAFGVSGVLIPEQRQAPVTGTVVKVSAGMAFKIPLVTIGNINTTIRNLKDRGFWIYGLEGTGTSSTTTEQFTHPAVFVLGNEANGIRQKTKEHCDVLLSIPINPRCESLNVAASTAVALSAWSVQHPEALK